MAESRREAMYGKKKADPEPMANVESDHEGGAGESEGDTSSAPPEDHRLAAWQALAKMHETERRDLHGSHREQHRAMLSRHEKAFKDLAEQHMAELGTQGAGPPPENDQESEPGEPSGMRGA